MHIACASRPLLRSAQVQCGHLADWAAQCTATRCRAISVQSRNFIRSAPLRAPTLPLSLVCHHAQHSPLHRPPRTDKRLRRRRGVTSSATAMENALPAGEVFFLDEFAVRQWDNPNCSGTRIDHDKADFVAKVHEYHAAGCGLVDGYAPFCKHVFVPNFVGAQLGALPITEQNRGLLRSAYVKRRPEELAVLARWFPADQVEAPQAKFLDVILYSREQLTKEYDAMPDAKGDPALLPRAPWGIISIKAQEENYETPMQPITIMRNSLGKDEGGSGVELDRKAYEESVAYWQGHAAISPGTEPEGE